MVAAVVRATGPTRGARLAGRLNGWLALAATGALRHIGIGIGIGFGIGFGIGMARYFASLGAGRMTAPVVGGLARLAVAAGGGAILSHCWGRDGNFIAVALGIVTYGVINAMGVNGKSWRPAAP